MGLCPIIALALDVHEASGKVLLDGGVVAGLEREGDVGQVLELVGLHDAEAGVLVRVRTDAQHGEEPRALLTSARDAFLEEFDELVGELREVDEDGLLHLERLKLLLGDFHVMEEERIRLAGHLDAKHLRNREGDGG